METIVAQVERRPIALPTRPRAGAAHSTRGGQRMGMAKNHSRKAQDHDGASLDRNHRERNAPEHTGGARYRPRTIEELEEIVPDIEAQFLSRVSREPHPKGCQIWTGSGYPPLLHLSRLRISARRVALILDGRPVPDGWIKTTCYTPMCVRPAHLRPKKIGRRQPRKTNRPTYRYPQATIAKVKEALAQGMSGRAIAAKYGVSPSYVSRIKNGSRKA